MKNKTFIFLSGIVAFTVLFLFPQEFASGFSAGLSNCANVVIPSLFPFLAASSLAGSGEMPKCIKKIAEPLTRRLYRLPCDCLPAIILGQVGGYLSGVKAADSLYSSGIISRSQARRLLLFCINSGMGFSVNAVGNALLNSRESGKILLLSLCISSLFIGFFIRFLPDDPAEKKLTNPQKISFSRAVVNSVSSSSSAMLVCCGFVCFFSGAIAVITAAVGNPTASLTLSCLLEVTSGCASAAGNVSLPVIAAVCAFGGICVHMQIFSLSEAFGVSIPIFYLFRIFHSVSAFAVCKIILFFFPVDIQTSLSVTADFEMWSFSAPAAISLLFLCSLLILDLDNTKKLC